MKRFLSILFVAVFALSLCDCSGNSGTPAPSTTATESAAPAGNTGSVADQGTYTSTGTKDSQDFKIPTDLPPVKIGCGGAFWGDSPEGAAPSVREGRVDYRGGDFRAAVALA